MANNKNLKRGNPATQFKSGQQAAESGRKGGIASGKAKKERKLIKDQIIERMGAKDWDDVINGVIDRAKISDKGFEVLRDTIGEKPKEDIAISGNVNNPFEGLTTKELKKLINSDK